MDAILSTEISGKQIKNESKLKGGNHPNQTQSKVNGWGKHQQSISHQTAIISEYKKKLYF